MAAVVVTGMNRKTLRAHGHEMVAGALGKVAMVAMVEVAAETTATTALAIDMQMLTLIPSEDRSRVAEKKMKTHKPRIFDKTPYKMDLHLVGR